MLSPGRDCRKDKNKTPLTIDAGKQEESIMKRRTALMAGILVFSVVFGGCRGNTAATPQNGTNEGQSSMEQETNALENSETSQPGTAEEERIENVSDLEDCRLRLIDCHQFEDDGEQFTYLAFALLGPADIGFHLEGEDPSLADAWLTSNHMENGWRVVTCTELPAGITTEEVSLSVTNYGTTGEDTVLLSDWGDPMNKEELQAVGLYEVEGHLVIVGEGRTAKSSDQYGFMVGLGLVGPEYGNPETAFPTLENPAQVFQFYAADGTPLAQSLGQEIDECFMTGSTLKVWFGLPEGTDVDTALDNLVEKAPYMEYTNADGETFQFPLNLSK